MWNRFKVNNKDSRTTFYCIYCWLWVYFTPFSSVSVIVFEEVKVCCVPPYQFINTEITYFWNYWQMYKNLSEVEAHKKRLWSKVEWLLLRKHFPCRLLYLISRNSFFQSTEFLYFTKVLAANHSSMDTVFFRRAIANINCIYTMH